MNATQENKVSMFYKVRTFFTNHEATLTVEIPYLSTVIPRFYSKIAEIQTNDMIATDDTIGYTEQKQIFRTNMRNNTLKVAGAIKAYGIEQAEAITIRKASITKSQIDNARDTDALYFCNKTLEKAQALGSAILTPYGVNDAVILSLENSVQAFDNFLQAPKDEKFEIVGAGKLVDKCIAECDEILQQVDALMETQVDNFPLLYLQYQGDRSIDDETGGSSPTPPDYVVSLAPNVFTEILTIPYNATQRFKAKNNGQADVNWSLSINNTSFSTPPIMLNAGAESNVLSSTLAPNGDILLFYNPSPAAIIVEVTLVDL